MSLSLDASLGLASGNPALSEKVGALATKILRSECTEDFNFSLSGLVIYPPGVSSGPSVIDQFIDIKIPIVFPKSDHGSSVGSWIDTSGFTDGLSLSSLGLKNEGLQFKTLPKAVLSLSADVGYDNKLPIKLVLPFVKAEIAMQDVPLVEQTIKGFILSKGAGVMSPSAELYFQQHDSSIQDIVAKAAAELDEKKFIESKISVRGLYFGVSESDK